MKREMGETEKGEEQLARLLGVPTLDGLKLLAAAVRVEGV